MTRLPTPEEREWHRKARNLALERATPENEEEYEAWVLFYDQEGENARNYRLRAIADNDVAFAQELVLDVWNLIPSCVVVDWPNTARGILTDYEDVALPNGRKAYFR